MLAQQSARTSTKTIALAHAQPLPEMLAQQSARTSTKTIALALAQPLPEMLAQQPARTSTKTIALALAQPLPEMLALAPNHSTKTTARATALTIAQARLSRLSRTLLLAFANARTHAPVLEVSKTSHANVVATLRSTATAKNHSTKISTLARASAI
jgi:hypothetical protein